VPRHWLVLGGAPPKYRNHVRNLFGDFRKWKFLVPTWHEKECDHRNGTCTQVPPSSPTPLFFPPSHNPTPFSKAIAITCKNTEQKTTLQVLKSLNEERCNYAIHFILCIITSQIKDVKKGSAKKTSLCYYFWCIITTQKIHPSNPVGTLIIPTI
jgi:hypothetical protein